MCFVYHSTKHTTFLKISSISHPATVFLFCNLSCTRNVTNPHCFGKENEKFFPGPKPPDPLPSSDTTQTPPPATPLQYTGICHPASHSVDTAGWQAKMATIELWIRLCNAHGPHSPYTQTGGKPKNLFRTVPQNAQGLSEKFDVKFKLSNVRKFVRTNQFQVKSTKKKFFCLSTWVFIALFSKVRNENGYRTQICNFTVLLLKTIVLFASAGTDRRARLGLRRPGQDWQESRDQFEIPLCHQAASCPE